MRAARSGLEEQGEHGGQTETQANEASSSFSHRKTPVLHHVDSSGQKNPAASRMKYELIMFFRGERHQVSARLRGAPKGLPTALIFLDEFGSARNCLDHHVGKVHQCPGPLCRPPSRTAPVLCWHCKMHPATLSRGTSDYCTPSPRSGPVIL